MMSFVSLEKYLYGSNAHQAPASDSKPVVPPAFSSHLELCTRTLSAIRCCVFDGDSFSDLSEALGTVQDALQVECDGENVSKHAARIESLLETFQQRTRDDARTRANDFKDVLNILNETFAHLHTGNEKSRTRLKDLEVALNTAARIDDPNRIRAHLGRMLDFVRQEAKFDQTEAQTTFETLTTRIRDAHAVNSKFRAPLPGKLEAIEHLSSEMSNRASCTDFYVALFVADTLRPLRVRHGDEIGAAALEELARAHISPLAPDGKVFCWSPTSLLLSWHHTVKSPAPGNLPNQLKSPVAHRAFVGTRVATFKFPVRSFVSHATGAIEELVDTLDRFSASNRP